MIEAEQMTTENFENPASPNRLAEILMMQFANNHLDAHRRKEIFESFWDSYKSTVFEYYMELLKRRIPRRSYRGADEDTKDYETRMKRRTRFCLKKLYDKIISFFEESNEAATFNRLDISDTFNRLDISEEQEQEIAGSALTFTELVTQHVIVESLPL